VSTDPAHNLSDAFCQKIGREPTPIQGFDNLSAMEIDANNDMEEMQRTVSEQGTDDDGGLSAMMSELTSSIPGIDEAMSFSELMKQVQGLDFDIVVFDTAPTGHTLRLLSFPTILEKALGKIMELKDRFGGLIGQALAMTGGGNPGATQDAIVGRLEETRAVINKVNVAFQDPTVTTFVSTVCHYYQGRRWTIYLMTLFLFVSYYYYYAGVRLHPGISVHLRNGTLGARTFQVRH
jgi:arsenite-transporting ATPase